MKKNIFFLLMLFCISESSAVPPDPGVYGIVNTPNQDLLSQTLPETTESISQQPRTLTTGPQKIIVILIEFQDVTHDPRHDNSYFHNLIFSNSNNLGLYSYYHEVSYNQMTISGTITGWYQSIHNMGYYGADGSKADNLYCSIYELAREAIKLADSAGFDFSQYDSNKDRYIDHIIIIHSGRGQETGGGAYGPDAIWSHHWLIWPPEEADGVLAADYSMVSEFSPTGTLAHEFGHDLGLPDLYDTDYSSQGIGAWGLMGYGSWQVGGNVPAHLCAWSKVFLGWVEPKVANFNEISLNCVEQSSYNAIIKIPFTSEEYFLLENRHKIGFDQYLPGSGLMIWHIDDKVGRPEFNNVNTDENHKRVDLEEADGRNDLDAKKNAGDNTDPYYMDNASKFAAHTIPDSRSYSEPGIRVSITNISKPGAIMNLEIHTGQNSAPTASSGGPYIGGVNAELTLNSTGSSDPDDDPLIYMWDFDARNGIQIDSTEQNPCYTYTETGIYTITLIVNDGELNSEISTTTANIKPVQEMSIDLVSGWNLISLYLQPLDTRCESILSSLGDKCQSVWTYNATSDMWQSYTVNGSPSPNPLDKLESGPGYWIMMNQPGKLRLKGVQPSESIPLKAGWNLAGYNSRKGISIQDYAYSIGDKLDSIGTYNPQNRSWLWYRKDNPEFLNSLKSLESGKGYMIHVNEDCVWNIDNH